MKVEIDEQVYHAILEVKDILSRGKTAIIMRNKTSIKVSEEWRKEKYNIAVEDKSKKD